MKHPALPLPASDPTPASPALPRRKLACIFSFVILPIFVFALASVARAQLYTQSQTLFGDPNQAEYFGYYVAASGDTLVVSTSSNKRIYVYVHTPSGWVLQQKIAANYPGQSYGRIAIDGDTLVAGTEIYVRSNGAWTLQQSLTFVVDTRPAIQGDTVAMGVPRNSNGDANGAVYVFTRSGTTWTQQALLLPDTPGQVQMGTQVRIDRGTIVAATQNPQLSGSAYGAYVFTGSGATWTQQARLASPTGGWWMSVAIDGDTVALSDPPNNVIHLFARSGTSWSLTTTIPLPAAEGNYFGDQLALTGGILAASADGTFYVMSKTSSGWIVGQSFARPGDSFGTLDLARGGKTFVLSNPFDNTKAYANGIVEAFYTPSPPTPGGPWQDDDVGTVGLAGSSTDNGDGSVTVRGSGADIWDRADQFHFRSQTLTGDGVIYARVTSTGNTNAWAKIGLMFREDLAPAAREAMVLLAPGGHFGTQTRADTADTTTFQDASWAYPPLWVKLARAGNTFTSYRSDDGSSWTPIGTATVVMPSTVYVGLAVTSHDNSQLDSAVFDHINLGPGGSQPPDRPNPPSNLTGALVTATSVHLQWTDNSTNETGFVIERGIGSSATQFLAMVGANVTEYTDAGLASGTTYTYQVRAAGSSNGRTVTSAASNPVTITTPSSGDSLIGSQLGSTDVSGSFSSSNGVYSIQAAGEDIWNESDSGYFVNRTVTGDFDLRAHITFVSDIHSWTKAGVMVRESLDASARNVFTLLTAENAAGMQVRDTSGGPTTFNSGPWVRAPYWVRLVRSGNVFQSFVSADGATWQSIGAATLALPTTLYAGIAMSSHVANTTAHVTADSLTFTTN